jgi:hypothetical protein
MDEDDFDDRPEEREFTQYEKAQYEAQLAENGINRPSLEKQFGWYRPEIGNSESTAKWLTLDGQVVEVTDVTSSSKPVGNPSGDVYFMGLLDKCVQPADMEF